MKRHFLLYLVLALVTTGLTPTQVSAAPDPFMQQIEKITALVEQKNWTEAEKHTDKLPEVFKRVKWKYQLLGDENEYEEIEKEIFNVRAAVHKKDSTQAAVSLASIRAMVHLIYTL
ncbi:DUF4363 family protein [Brevibacillus fulvus]|uniref:Ribonuclease HII n=1 Tax=Brevibacillus fulvus TaxID=1125967 RepID=A0A938Y173_9BACL|nr:DUF4363 family protein [Brevibacillus fulvus]MBM7592044.1 ribonuclease HII [Brevibacillus fulvus]